MSSKYKDYGIVYVRLSKRLPLGGIGRVLSCNALVEYSIACIISLVTYMYLKIKFSRYSMVMISDTLTSANLEKLKVGYFNLYFNAWRDFFSFSNMNANSVV